MHGREGHLGQHLDGGGRSHYLRHLHRLRGRRQGVGRGGQGLGHQRALRKGVCHHRRGGRRRAGGEHRVQLRLESGQLLPGALGHKSGIALVRKDFLLHKTDHLPGGHALVAPAGHAVEHGQLPLVKLQQLSHFRGRVGAGILFVKVGALRRRGGRGRGKGVGRSGGEGIGRWQRDFHHGHRICRNCLHGRSRLHEEGVHVQAAFEAGRDKPFLLKLFHQIHHFPETEPFRSLGMETRIIKQRKHLFRKGRCLPVRKLPEEGRHLRRSAPALHQGRIADALVHAGKRGEGIHQGRNGFCQAVGVDEEEGVFAHGLVRGDAFPLRLKGERGTALQVSERGENQKENRRERIAEAVG